MRPPGTERKTRPKRRKAAAGATPDFRLLFESLPGSFVVVLPDAPDFTIVAASNRYLREGKVTRTELIGQPAFDALPLPQPSLDAVKASFERVLAGRNAETVAVEMPEQRERRWISVSSPVLAESGEISYIIHRLEIAAEFAPAPEESNLAALKSLELRNSFLVKLDDATRVLSDPYEVTRTAARFLCEHLQANRCAYSEVKEDGDNFDVLGGYHKALPKMTGSFRLSQFGEALLAGMRAGEEFVLSDAETDPRLTGVRDAYRESLIRSAICVPLHKGDRLTAVMAVHQSTPRQWKVDEVELVQLVSNRCWEALERAHAVRELQKREEHFRFLAESIPQMLWTGTSDGLLSYLSEQGLTYLGVDEKTVLGEGWLAWVHEEDRAQAIKNWMQSLATATLYQTSYRLRRHDGVWRWHLVRGVPFLNAAGEVLRWYGTCTDITDQKHIEEQLRRTNHDLEEFSFVASHDLQEPLRIVHLYTQLLVKALGETDGNVSKYAGFVQQGVVRMQTLIRDLLTFSKAVHSGEQTQAAADLPLALEEAVNVLKDRIEESGARIAMPSSLPCVRGATDQLAHVFQNLLSNAIKYGKKEVPPEIQITVQTDSHNCTISFRDKGIGFDQKYAETIFGLFKRLHARDDYPGTGLGLAICKRIVERSGGRLWAEGKLGEGAVFHIVLPLAEMPLAGATSSLLTEADR